MGILTHRQIAIEITGRAEGQGAARRWPVVVSTENPVRRRDIYGEEYDEVLSHAPGAVDLSRAPLPVLEGHDSSRVNIGIVDGLRLEGGKLRGELVLGSSARAQELAADIDAGIVGGVSVGYEILKTERSERDGMQQITARLWRPYEASIVSIPADINAGINRSADMANANDQEIRETEADAARAAEDEMDEQREEGDCECAGEPDCECEEREADAADAPAPSAEAGAEARSAAPAGKRAKRSKPAVKLSPADLERARADAVKAERDRVAGIQRAVRAAKLGDDFADKLIRDGVSLADARKRALEALEERDMSISAGRTPGSHVTAGEDSRDKWLRGAEAGILTRSGTAHYVQAAAQKRGEKVDLDAAEFANMSLLDLARDHLERNGYKPRELRMMTRQRMVGLALTLRSGEQTTSDFAVLLENALYKVLLAAYETAPVVWPRFCKVGTVTDFRPHPRYRRGMLGRLQKVNEGGEIKQITVPDGEKVSVTAETYAGILALSRQAIINDDMGVFSDLAVQAGETAAYSIELDVFDLLQLNSGLGPQMADGNTLFHAAHNNIGTDSALTVAGIDADRVLMAKQKDPSGKRVLNMTPKILLVPVDLGGQARVINQSTWDIDAVAANATNKFEVPNKVNGLFSDIVESALLTDATRRWMFADPNRYPTIEVSFLDGQRAPYLESREGWRIDGVEWKVRSDRALGALDHRSAVTNDGTP
jgi:HK97 family phage prohead protease